ncbi:MAG: GIY-YIG nuclease family protein [Thermoplasmatota archaeon]
MTCGDPSVYLLVLHVESDSRVEIGKAGSYLLRAGTYVYTGSAKSGLGARARRHLGYPDRRRWHIDYVTPLSAERAVFRKGHTETGECEASALLGQSFDPVEGVGSSDCWCAAHLFFAGPGRRWL